MRSVTQEAYSGNADQSALPLLQLKNDCTHLKEQLKELQEIDSRMCPYAGYLEAMLLQQLRSMDNHPVSQQVVDTLLFRAAQSGVTNAARELLHNTLKEKNCTFPTSAAARLLLCCASKSAGYDLRIVPVGIKTEMDSPLDQALGTINNYLPVISQAEASLRLAESLQQMAATCKKPARERILMLAAVCFSLAGQHTRVKNCQKKACSDYRIPLASQRFDWLSLSLFDEGSKVTFDSPLWLSLESHTEAKTCQSLLSGAQAQFLKQASAINPTTEDHWFDWLPLCVPLSRLPNNELKKVLEGHWPEHILQMSDVQGAHPRPASKVMPQFNPLAAKYIREAHDANDSDTSICLIADNRNMDYFMKLLLTPNSTIEANADSVVWKGIEKTTEALKLLGAKATEKSPQIDLTTPCNAATQQEALLLLEEAMSQYGNPYAAWLYSRIQRTALAQNMATPEGKANWYNHYLTPLLFAAIMGVEGAADDLFVELIEGHADSLMVPILDILCNRYQRACNLSLQFNTPWDLPGELAQKLRAYHRKDVLEELAQKLRAYHRKDVLTESPHKDWQSFLCDIVEFIPTMTAGKKYASIDRVRQVWITVALFSLIEKSSTSTCAFAFHNEDKALDIPLDLQVSMSNSLSYLQKDLFDDAQKDLQSLIGPELQSFIQAQPKSTSEQSPEKLTVPADVCRKLLSTLLWQRPRPGLTLWVDRLKQLAYKKKPPKEDHIGEQLIMLYHCTRQADNNAELPGKDHPLMPVIQPWLCHYQWLMPNATIQLTSASPGLDEHAQKLQGLDDAIYSQLVKATDEDEGEGLASAKVIQLFTQKPKDRESPIVLELTEDKAQSCLEQLESLKKSPSLQLYDPYPPLIAGLCLAVCEEPPK